MLRLHRYPGVHQLLASSIYKTDIDLRKALFGQIVLSGGSTMFPGFGDRLLRETRKLAPAETTVRIVAPKQRDQLAWVGGSILASLGSFSSMWVLKAQYEEHGASLLHRPGL